MQTYHVSCEIAGFSRKRKLLRGLLVAGLYVVLNMAFSLLWPSWMSSRNVSGEFVEAVLGGVIFAFLFVALMKRNLDYKVVVSDDCITAVHPKYKRSVRKSEVKTVAESDGNILAAPSLRISKYGRLGTWFLGGIWIPRALPEYEYLRNLALSWKGRLQA
jgi:hypothetical protein